MFRVWAKCFHENHLVKDLVVEVPDWQMTRTNKVFTAMEQVCYSLDLPKPIWLALNIKDFKRYSKTRFTQDSFIEQLPFDYLEFQVIEE